METQKRYQILKGILQQRRKRSGNLVRSPTHHVKPKKKVTWGNLYTRIIDPEEEIADTTTSIPLVTKSEEKEVQAEELSRYFPDSNITGLVVRRRKVSNASIDLDDPVWNSSVPSNIPTVSSSSLPEEDSSGKAAVDPMQEVLLKGYRKRSSAEGRPR